MLTNPADKTAVRNALSDGYGIEDIAVMEGLPEEQVRSEVRFLARTNQLEIIYSGARRKWGQK